MADYPEGPVTVECDGFDLRIYPDNSMLGRALYDGTATADGMQVLETDLLAVLDRACFDGMTAVDVGANWGYHALRSAANCDADRILAVDAHPEVAETLRHNVRINEVPIEVREVAVAAEGGTQTLWDLGSDADLNTLATEEYDHLGPEVRESVSVEAVTVESLLESAALDHVDLLKVDVEGAEGRVLAGVGDAWERIDGVALEVHPLRMRDFGDAPVDVVRTLHDAGLTRIRHFDNDGSVERLSGDPETWVADRFAVRDDALHTLLAVRPESTFGRRVDAAVADSRGSDVPGEDA